MRNFRGRRGGGGEIHRSIRHVRARGDQIIQIGIHGIAARSKDFQLSEGTKFRFIDDGGGPRESRLHDTGLRYYTLMRAGLPRTRYVRMKDKRHLSSRDTVCRALIVRYLRSFRNYRRNDILAGACRGNFR